MIAVINEKQITEEQADKLELETIAPEKFDPEFEFALNKEHADVKKDSGYGTYTPEQVQKLIAASRAEPEPTPYLPRSLDYPTPSREQIEQWMTEHYEYKERERKRKKENGV